MTPAPAVPVLEPALVRRVRPGLALVAVIALLGAVQSLWTVAASPPAHLDVHLFPTRPLHAAFVLISVAMMGVLLVCAVLVLGAGGRSRVVRWVEPVLLLIGSVTVLGRFLMSHLPNDEGALVNRAAFAVLHGQQVYGVRWPEVFATQPLTKTMNGGGDYTFGYPPLDVLVTAAVARVVHHPVIAAPLVSTLALIGIALVLWFSVPATWRSGIVLVVLAVDPLDGFAWGGSPILIAVLLLVPVLLHFDRIGITGRLGRPGVLRAICLGAACAAQQLPWFVAPFLAVALFALREPELGARKAAGLVARFVGVAVLTWVVIDLPFLLTQPVAWFKGILLPLTQHAIVHGQGLVDVPYLITSGSGALDLLSSATIALFLGLLLLLVVLPARVGPGLVVLPVMVFFVATRPSYDYWVQLAPLWIAFAGTVPVERFAHAWRPALLDRMRPVGVRSLAALLLAPAAVLTLVGILAPPPLHLTLQALVPLAPGSADVGEVDLTAVNVSDHALTPHFASRATGSASNFWRVLSGPSTLQPGQRATYRIQPKGGTFVLQDGGVILAVSDRPMTITNLRLPATLPRGR